jgi:hypothetical protein
MRIYPNPLFGGNGGLKKIPTHQTEWQLNLPIMTILNHSKPAWKIGVFVYID